MKILTLILLITFGVSSIAAAKEILIPRSVSGDKGQYYLIEFKKRGKIYFFKLKCIYFNIKKNNCK